MFFFLHGPDDFRRREKLNKYVAAYREKNKSSFSLFRLDGEDDDFLDEFARAAESQSMFGGKKLLIVNDVFGASKDVREKLQETLEARLDYFKSDGVFIFFTAAEVDRREKLFKFLTKEAHVEVFENLKGITLEKWVKEKARVKGTDIDREAVVALVNLVGGDSVRLEEELEKLSLFKPAGKISASDVSEVVFGSGFNFFGLLDAFSSGDRKAFLFNLEKALSGGENPVGLTAALAGQARVLLMAGNFLAEGKSASELASRLGIHPYVAEKAMSFAGNRKIEELEDLFLKLSLADREIKTGRIDPASTLVTVFADI